MTTYTISGQMIVFDTTGAQTVATSVVPVQLNIVMPDPNTTFSYNVFGSGPGFLDAVTIDLNGALDVRISGPGVAVDAAEFIQFEAQLGTVETPDGMSTNDILNIYNFSDPDNAFRDFYFDLGGASAVPIFASPSAAQTYIEDITILGGIETGPFANPDTPIAYTAFPTTTVTQDDLINGSAGNDVIAAGAGSDTIFGFAGDDTISGGAGADTLDGGADIDTLSYADSNAAVNVSLINGTAVGGHATGDQFSNFENLTGSAFADILTGSVGANQVDGLGGNDLINGSSAADTLLGGSGNDTLIGSAGGDTLDGGTGIDTASYFNSNAAVQINLATGTAGGGHAAGDSFAFIENVLGSTFNDTLTGNGGANALTGGQGVDTLDGGSGTDVLSGQAGDDIFISGLGADTMNGGSGTDLVDYSGSNAGVDARIGATTNSGGHAQGDFLSGVEDLTGSAFADTLVGSDLVNTLIGGNGNDTLNGANNADTLNGGLGNDTLIGSFGADAIDGGAGIDTASYFSSNVGVIVNLVTGTGSLGHAGGDTLQNIERLLGSLNGNDRLIGDDGANTLEGYNGSDWLNGGGGNDLLRMGNADGVQDRALYGQSGFGNDTVTQFEDEIDILDMRGLGISFADVNAAQSGGNTILTFDGVSGQVTLTNFTATDIDAGDFFF